MSENNKKQRKNFSLKEANKALVLVKKITHDIVSKWNSLLNMDDTQRYRNLLDVKKESEITSLPASNNIIQQIQYHIKELLDVGCYIKDMNKGIVLFPTEENGEPSYLKWQLGDDAIQSTMNPGNKILRI